LQKFFLQLSQPSSCFGNPLGIIWKLAREERKPPMPIQRTLRLVAAVTSVLVLSLSPVLLFADSFTQTNLVSNVTGLAATTDPNLKNPWGMSFSPTSPFWISNQGSGNATLYDGAGNIVPLVVSVPSGTSPVTGPTGQVFNGTTSFALPSGGATHFIFDTLGGTIDGWSGGTSAATVVTTPGAVYTGLALASSGGSNYLYAADSTGQIRVFNSSYQPVTLTGNFTDPNAVAGFVPFNIQLIGSSLYVTYAKLTAQGTGLPGGYVDVFNTNGTFLKRQATGGPLYAPWGITLAPSTFGSFGNDLLIGNFGNGEIDVYNPTTNAFVGTLDGANGMPLVNDFLWSLDFRTGGANVNINALYFTAGINNQQDGLFGDITPTSVSEPATFILDGLGVFALGLARLWRLAHT
jgi:uncharacterized protein (TIGR03118 family)